VDSLDLASISMASFFPGTGISAPTRSEIHVDGLGRYTVWAYETALIDECDYKGAQPYWDWTLDTPEFGRHFNESPVFDPVLGFGGNSMSGSVPDLPFGSMPNMSDPMVGNCISDGPFAGLTSSLGPGFALEQSNPHCLVRNFNVSLADDSLQWTANVLPLMNNTDFFAVTQQMDRPPTNAPIGVHGGGHSGVGGEASDAKLQCSICSQISNWHR
jgi:tyrosinase